MVGMETKKALDVVTATDPRGKEQRTNRLAPSESRQIVKARLDWQARKNTLLAMALVLITTVVVVIYYVNHPHPEISIDSGEYLSQARLIQTQGQVIDPHRVPGFSLLITAVFMLTGQGNVMAVSIVNALLFILATIEMYCIALLIFRQGWAAFLIGLLVGANIGLITFVKPILSEALTLWLLVSLAWVTVLFIQRFRTRYLWLMATLILGLFLTRPEWIFVAIPLYAYLILLARRQKQLTRRLLAHTIASVLLLYSALAGYIAVNATQYHYFGVADTQNFNTWGKVIQYDMQNEAPPQYARITAITNTFHAHGGLNPYTLVQQNPWLAQNHYELVGAYSRAIIEGHLGEYLAKSAPVAISSLSDFYFQSQVDPRGPFGNPLIVLQLVARLLYKFNLLFPVCAVAWLFLLFWRRTAQLSSVQGMGALILLVLYGVMTTTIGGFASYPRYHTPFNPLLIILIWGSLVAIVQVYISLIRGRNPGVALQFPPCFRS